MQLALFQVAGNGLMSLRFLLIIEQERTWAGLGKFLTVPAVVKVKW